MVKIQAKRDAVLTYKKLLITEWTKTLPQEVLSLLWRMIAKQNSTGESEDLWQALNPTETSAFPAEYFRSIVERIADATRFVRFFELPDLAIEDFESKRSSRPSRMAKRLALYLTLPAHVPVSGKTEFFADVQALAFQAAVHFVLPELRSKHEAEHALLLHSTALFCIGYSAYEPAHYAYMMSMIHDYLGDKEQRLRTLLASFRFTSPKDHSYLTKAQEFWTELLDQGKSKEAQNFLLSLEKWSLPSQQDEVREMVVDAFKYMVEEDAHSN